MIAINKFNSYSFQNLNQIPEVTEKKPLSHLRELESQQKIFNRAIRSHEKLTRSSRTVLTGENGTLVSHALALEGSGIITDLTRDMGKIQDILRDGSGRRRRKNKRKRNKRRRNKNKKPKKEKTTPAPLILEKEQEAKTAAATTVVSQANTTTHSTVKDMSKIYTPWGKWSRCKKTCRQVI